MRGGSIAKRYATALLGVAKDSGKLEEIHQELDRLVETIQGAEDLKISMESPVLPPSQKKAVLSKLKDRLELSVEVENLVRILIDQNRVALLPMIGLLYRDLTDEALGRVRVHVRAAAELGELESKLKEVLAKALNSEIILQVQVDPTLLGGMVVQVKDRVFDASLKRNLERIKESIIEKAVA